MPGGGVPSRYQLVCFPCFTLYLVLTLFYTFLNVPCHYLLFSWFLIFCRLWKPKGFQHKMFHRYILYIIVVKLISISYFMWSSQTYLKSDSLSARIQLATNMNRNRVKQCAVCVAHNCSYWMLVLHGSMIFLLLLRVE